MIWTNGGRMELSMSNIRILVKPVQTDTFPPSYMLHERIGTLTHSTSSICSKNTIPVLVTHLYKLEINVRNTDWQFCKNPFEEFFKYFIYPVTIYIYISG